MRPQKRCGVQITFTVTRDVKDLLLRIVEREDRPLGAVLRRAIDIAYPASGQPELPLPPFAAPTSHRTTGTVPRPVAKKFDAAPPLQGPRTEVAS